MQKNLWKHLPTDFDRFMKSPRQNGNIVTSMNGKQQLRYEKKNEIRIFHSRFGFDLGWINSLQRSDLTQIDAWYPRNVKLEWLGHSCEKLSEFKIFQELPKWSMYPYHLSCPNVFGWSKRKCQIQFAYSFLSHITN